MGQGSRIYEAFTLGNWLYYLIITLLVVALPVNAIFEGIDSTIQMAKSGLLVIISMSIFFGVISIWACVYENELSKLLPNAKSTLGSTSYARTEKRIASIKAFVVIFVLLLPYILLFTLC